MKKEQWYDEMPMWNEYATCFPNGYGVQAGSRPREEYWSWNGNRVHLDVYRNDSARTKIVMLHGVGGNGRVLSFIAAPLHRAGFEVVAPDLPGYGLTEMPEKSWDYNTWIDIATDLVAKESGRDDRPIVLFGLSAGGMLAYQVATRSSIVRAVAASCVLDFREPEVLESSARSPTMGRFGVPVLRVLAKIVPRLMLPMKMVANAGALANKKELLDVLIDDRHSAGAWVPLALMASMTSTSPAVEPERFLDRPFLLVHPEDDRWVDVGLSRIFFDRLACPKKLVMLEGAGHLPCERPGIDQMMDALLEFLATVTPSRSKTSAQGSGPRPNPGRSGAPEDRHDRSDR